MRWGLRGTLIGFVVLWVMPGVVVAHGFGSRYELSLPRWMFIGGGAAVVVVSFVIVSLYAGRENAPFEYTTHRLVDTPLAIVTSSRGVAAVRGVVVVFVLLVWIAGLVGPSDFNENPLTNVVWVGWWVGYTFSVIFVGNTWPILNPWKTVYEWVTTLLDRDPSFDRTYTFEDYPLLLGFLLFAWLEIVAPISRSPKAMAVLIGAYSVYLWGGMIVYGKDTWLRHGDPFTRLYHYLGKFAPVTLRDGGEIRMYGVGLVEYESTLYNKGGLAFLVAVLYTVTFDGFIATPAWVSLALSVPSLPVRYLTTTILMVSGIVLFVIAYVGFGWVMARIVDTRLSGRYLARRFAQSLLPIAIVYQVSHFYTFLLIQGQFLILSLADPFGRGWNPLGIGGFEPTATIPLLSVQVVWQSQVALIVLGHVIAVWVAHHIALDVFPDRRSATLSQLPMMALMVVYTMVSLWILTQPVVEPPLP